MLKLAAVPPPTRGWPVVESQSRAHCQGSPAHAGMARTHIARFRPPGRFPRPRGDGPVRRCAAGRTTPVPPPTRGWPHSGGCAHAGRRGSPAHAGMALRHAGSAAPCTRFPRPRGDGPLTSGGFIEHAEVPPPTRGWPVGRDQLVAWAGGSPAHAGMARHDETPSSPSFWFPRPRGDGPAMKRAKKMGILVPPPTRGWPSPALTPPPFPVGSPAHAGMAQGHYVYTAVQYRFPRPRGDGPLRRSATRLTILVPPPTRGWPMGDLAPEPRGHGSPAHAGMAPCQRWRCGAFERFPRPRGDGPPGSIVGDTVQTVPPPTRGWPSALWQGDQENGGSPAHAGMARLTSAPGFTATWFPRPRGDGPAVVAA